MVEEIYDVILKVPSNGIHSPWNLHAFKITRNMLPVNCLMCHETIYPFIISTICVRCGGCVHRSCTRNDHNICSKFLIGPMDSSLLTLSWGVTGSIIEKNETKMRKSTSKQVIQVANSVIQSTSNLLSQIQILPDGPFPKPGSDDCLWRKALRQIASKFNILRLGPIPHHSPGIIARVTQSLLRDKNSFPGRVAYELRNLFLALTFSSDREILLHAREMLDNISCSIFIILPVEINKELYLRLVITIVDWFVLKEHDGSIYDIVWNASHRLTEAMDHILVNKLLENRDLYKDVPSNISLYEEIEGKLSLIPCEYSGMDKLKRIVQSLKYLSASVSPESNSSLQNTNEQSYLQDMSVDADLLMKRFIDVIAYYTIKYEIYWYAECLFIEYLCTESSWMNDAEGYAFVSLQQALRSLCPSAAIISAANSNVEVVVDLPTVQHNFSSTRGDAPINSE